MQTLGIHPPPNGVPVTRIQAALVLAAAGDRSRFHQLTELLRRDWRDVLVAGGLAHGDWRERLCNELAEQSEQE